LKPTYLHYQTALCYLHGIGPIRAKEIIRSLGSLDYLFLDSPSKLEKKTGFKKKLFEEMKKEEALKEAERIIKFNKEKSVTALFYTDKNFPRRLNNCCDAPLMIFVKGQVDLNDFHFVSIVGTRAATTYGQKICKDLIRSFQGKKIVVVSGLAYGIDAWAHHYCIEYNVPTIAVLGHGLDRIYPQKNRELAKRMIKDGALITEFPPNTNPDRENFPKRNRIVAGMSDATIVVESMAKGGSLITALLANDYNRDVFAFPGSIHQESSIGCNNLIFRNQAHLLQSPENFLKQMNWLDDNNVEAIQRKIFPSLNAVQKKIIDLLNQTKELQIDVLSLKLKIPISKLNIELFNLEMEGVVICKPGKKYFVA
jgi:DNA processing protein